MIPTIAQKRMVAMKAYCALYLVLCLVFSAEPVSAQMKLDRKEDERGSRIMSPLGLEDRAGGVHNKSNIGSYFVNRGKLYASDYSQGPTFEWPIGSQHEFVYRANPWVGIPGNVAQGRFYSHSEWEAAAGYNNRDSAQPAFSDRPWTWPASGWHMKDAAGKPIFVSDQDSYCVYNDSDNTVQILNLQINQTGYAYSSKRIRDMVIYIFDVTNRSTQTYDSLYFGMYADIAAGGSYDRRDYGFRRMVFDKTLKRLYLYKPSGVSYEWNGGPSGYFGVIMLQTPKVNGVEVGVTDWHYSKYADEQDQDWVQYGILSSSPTLYADQLGPKFFHPGANAPDLHYDDPATIPAAGADITSTMSSGPYTLAPGDTLRFITAWIGGSTPADIDVITDNAYKLLAHGLAAVKPPESPIVRVVPGDKKVAVTWSNQSEASRDLNSGAVNFEGYRLYRSFDRGAHWDQIDRNVQPTGPDPVPFAVFDKVDGIPPNAGLQHSYIDSSVTNGFEYWYSVTAYSTPDSDNVVSENAIGRSGDVNVGVATPRSSATGRTPVSATPVQPIVQGAAAMNFTLYPLDVPQAGGQVYSISFAPIATLEQGSLRSVIQVSIDSNNARTAQTFSLAFVSPTQYTLRNLTLGAVIISAGAYTSGSPILFEGIRLILTDTSAIVADHPKQGDSLLVRVGVQMTAGTSQIVLPLQPLYYGCAYASSNDVIFSMKPADSLGQGRVTYRDQFGFATTSAQVSPTTISADLDKIKVVPNPYMVSSQYEVEFGILRKEPIRQLKFNNLPPVCTIYIFTVAGDKVKTINHASDNGTETWDMRTDGNRVIAAGVYIYLVKTNTAEKIGRFAVIK
jgi:hypothetical protein